MRRSFKGSDNFDCSGFIKYVYEKSGLSIPAGSYKQADYVNRNFDIIKLEKGDLIFFDTDDPKQENVSHVGIYMGKDEFQFIESRGGGRDNGYSNLGEGIR